MSSQPPRLADRVQRIVEDDLPVLHVEPEVPEGRWPLVVEGLLARPLNIDLAKLRSRTSVVRYTDMHCVWGWSKPALRWEGIPVADLCREAGPDESCSAVLFTARGGSYASCFGLTEALQCLLAWRVEGHDLTPEHGWPLRLVPPSTKWAYKAVKWVERVTFLDRFVPGAWEQRVGDPGGTVPWPVLQRFDVQSSGWTNRITSLPKEDR